MKYWITLLILVPAIGWADLVFDVRGNDPGLTEIVTSDDVTVEKTFDFTGESAYFVEKIVDGGLFQVNATLEGMETACIDSGTFPNPCQFDDTPGCEKPNGRVFDNPKPTVPFTVKKTDQGGEILHYDTFRSPTGRASFSRRGCAELEGADWGDGPWAVVFDEHYSAVCFDVRFNRPGTLIRQHFNGWAEQEDGTAKMIFHIDLAGETDQNRHNFCFIFDEPVKAITTWTQGIGEVWWLAVHVGEPATTECERAIRDADDAADDAVQACQ